MKSYKLEYTFLLQGEDFILIDKPHIPLGYCDKIPFSVLNGDNFQSVHIPYQISQMIQRIYTVEIAEVKQSSKYFPDVWQPVIPVRNDFFNIEYTQYPFFYLAVR